MAPLSVLSASAKRSRAPARVGDPQPRVGGPGCSLGEAVLAVLSPQICPDPGANGVRRGCSCRLTRELGVCRPGPEHLWPQGSGGQGPSLCEGQEPGHDALGTRPAGLSHGSWPSWQEALVRSHTEGTGVWALWRPPPALTTQQIGAVICTSVSFPRRRPLPRMSRRCLPCGSLET